MIEFESNQIDSNTGKSLQGKSNEFLVLYVFGVRLVGMETKRSYVFNDSDVKRKVFKDSIVMNDIMRNQNLEQADILKCYLI